MGDYQGKCCAARAFLATSYAILLMTGVAFSNAFNIPFEESTVHQVEGDPGIIALASGSDPIAPNGYLTIEYSLNFSTFFGGSDWEHTRDVFIDYDGNIFVVGGTASLDFPVTPGAYDETFNSGGTQSPQPCDAYIAKFSPIGDLVWSTYLGGPNYDRAYAVEVDDSGYVYVAGRAGVGFPVTPGSFQTTFEGTTNPSQGYGGMQNGFVAKLSPDGSSLVWAGYVGISSLARDLAIDSEGNVYVPMGNDGGGTINASWFTNAFQKTQQGLSESGVMKIKNDGSEVLWATWLGGSDDDSGAASIRVDDNGYVYIGTSTFSADMPTTLGAHDSTFNGGVDFYVAKLLPDGSNLSFATYIGGSGNEWISTHNLAIDDMGNTYVAIPVSSDYPTTIGAYQTTFHGGSTDWGISKFNSTGALVASTFLGGSLQENADGIYVDDVGNVFITGETGSSDFPVTNHAIQSSHGGIVDAIIVALSADLSKLLYSTFLGSADDDKGRTGFFDRSGNMYVAGQVDGSGWPTRNAYQSTYAGGSLDSILAKLMPLNYTQYDEPPSITILEPGGSPGQIYLQGDIIEVEWSTNDDMPLPSNPINISYGNASLGWSVLANNEMDDGSYSWDTAIVGPGVYWMNVSVFDSAGQETYDLSNFSYEITISDDPPVVSVHEPGGAPGQFFNRGEIITVVWVASDDHVLPPSPINISIGSIVDGWNLVAADEANDGSYQWDTSSVQPGMYWINISVFDTAGHLAYDICNHSFKILLVDNTPPTANAGPDQNVVVGQVVTLDGSMSHDDGGISNFTWNFTYNDSLIVLYGVNPSFNFSIKGDYLVSLEVWDQSGNSASDTMWINVSEPGGNGNYGSNQTRQTDYTIVMIAILTILALFLIIFFLRRKKKQAMRNTEE